MNKSKAEPGTVIAGTHRSQDLIPAFLTELERIGTMPKVVAAARVSFDSLDFDDDEDHETATFIVEDLFDALDECAPHNHYFGCHPGDGSDFGFWPLGIEKVYPARWASALVNGDFSSSDLDDADIAGIRKVIDEYGDALDVSEGFIGNYNGLLDTMATYVFECR